jgi:glycosyltransferase involved in cell wall biosynthesis
MHILELTDFYKPIIGGLERHVETLSRELTRLGHRVTVVTLQTGDEPTEETLDEVRVIRIRGWSGGRATFHADAARPFHPPFPDPGAVAALRQVLQRERPDVVHSHSWLQYSYFPLYHVQRGPAHVVTLHDYGLACPRKTLQRTRRRVLRSVANSIEAEAPSVVSEPCSGPRLPKCLTCAPRQYGVLKGTAITSGLSASRILHGRADRYIAVSAAVADSSQCAMSGGSEIGVVPTMVPNHLPELAQSTPRPAFLPSSDGYLMFVGALSRHKGIDVLLEARRRMHNRVQLVLIGTPSTTTPRIDDPEIVVARDVPSEQVMASWIRASVAVVPSVWHEPLAQTAIEAMIVGRPVIASDVGGLRDLIEDGVTGLLVAPGEPSSLAEALDRILDDPAKRERMAEMGQLRAREFEVSAVAPLVVKVFEEALLCRGRQVQ